MFGSIPLSDKLDEARKAVSLMLKSYFGTLFDDLQTLADMRKI